MRLPFVIVLVLFCLVWSNCLQAQSCQPVSGVCPGGACAFPANVEKGCNCYDGVDNDGDGRIDISDADCATYYGLTFVGQGSSCSINPPPGTAFTSVGAPQTSNQNTADTPAKLGVGDMNGDGVPDVAVTSKWNSTLQVVSTSNSSGFKPGDIMGDFTTPGSKIFPKAGSNYVFEHEVAIADINKDKIGEIYAIASERGGSPNNPPVAFFLTGFRYASGKGNLVPLFDAVSLGPDRPGSIGIADFDGDGRAEIYLRDEIYAAESGVKLADGGGVWDTQVNAGPVAVNMTGTNNLELVCGNLIYTVPSLSGRTLQTMTVFRNMNALGIGPSYYPKGFNDLNEYGRDHASTTSTADFDGDGFIDVFITGAINCSGNEAVPCGTNATTIFYWNVQKNTLQTFTPPDATYPLGWIWGTGRINLVDANGDGKLEALFVAGSRMFCLGLDAGGNLVQLWVRTINDSLSGILSLTVYDFDNDGNPEVVYRDSQQLVICDGKTGATTKWSTLCQSHTWTEGPIIADVNGDGGTDICITCYTGTSSFDINKATPQQQSLGQTRLYFSSSNAWLPTRSVWNQHPYYVTNINDNLTLPFPQINPSLVFSNAPCPNGLPGPQRPLNLFMDQVPRLSKDGCPEYPAPDLTFYGDDPAQPGVDTNGDGVVNPTVVVTPPICGNLAISAYFNIVNNGSLGISDNVPVSFFNGDPRTPAATLLFSGTINLSNLIVGQTFKSPTFTFNGPGTAFPLYILLYNNGAVIPVSLAGTSTKECTITNNIYNVQITPSPFTVTVEKTQDNFKCAAAAPNTGSLRARIFIGGVEVNDYSPYSFQWYNGTNTASPIAGPAGTQYNLQDLDAGTYSVIVTNTQKGCSSAIVSGTIATTGSTIPIQITVVSNQTNCSPANGELLAAPTDGSTGYTYNWFDNSLNPIATGPNIKNLTAGNYILVASKSGCSRQFTSFVTGPTFPDAQASTLSNVVNCANLNSGSVTANALISGVVQNPAGYTFTWYFYDNATSTRGSVLPPLYGTGQTRTGLPVGYYQAVVTNNATNCVATQTPITQVTDSRSTPIPVISQVAPQTSCDPNNPNGSLISAVNEGGSPQSPSNYTFEWFKGANTLPANLVTTTSGINGQQVNKVAGGGIPYTVKVTNANNCFSTAQFVVTETLVNPVLSISVTNNGICNPALAASNYTGALSASVTFSGSPVSLPTANYTIIFHNGPTIASPVLATGQTPTLGQLNGGTYTVEAIRSDLACAATPQTVVISNTTTLPTITSTPVPSTNCAGGAPNGSASATVGGTTVGYTFKWYQGNTTAGVLVGNTPAVNGLQGGQNFTVEVVNTATGCVNTQTSLVADNSSVPVVSLAPTANTICNPALTNPSVQYNGTVLASVTDQGTSVTSFANYTFTWYDGATTTTVHSPASTTRQLNNLNGAQYTAIVKNNVLNCTSVPVTVTVANNQTLPVIATNFTPSTNCDPALKNGQVAVTNVDGASPTSPYVFAWYAGSTATGPVLATTAAASNLQGGVGVNYTVLVTNQNTGCTNTASVQLPDNRVIPLLSLSPVSNTICDPSLTSPFVNFNGSITANVTNPVGPIGNYSFSWFDGNTIAVPHLPATSGNLLAQLDGAKQYSVTARHTPTGCTSVLNTITVNNSQNTPVITAATVASTNCDPALKNGSASVTDVDGLGTGVPFVYAWFAGNAASGPTLSTNSSLTSIQGGVNPVTSALYDYTVRVTNQNTGCRNTRTVQVTDQSVLPTLSLVQSANTICNLVPIGSATNYDGSVTATVTNQVGPLSNYLFTWSTGLNGAGINQLQQVNAGSYTVNARATLTGCVSSNSTITVTNNLTNPVATSSVIGSTNCPGGAPNGQAQITGITNPLGKTYDYKWYDGNTAGVGPVRSSVATYANLQGGNIFTSLITVMETGCQTSISLAVPDNSVLPVLGTLSKTDNTFCVGSNGTATIGTVTDGGSPVSAPYTGYTLAWSTGGSTPTISNLAAGTYTLTIRNNVLNCTSSPVSVNVNNNRFIPVLNVAVTPQTSCVPASPNGILAATIDETSIGGSAAATAGYSFSWVNNGNPFATPGTSAGSTSTISNLAGNLNFTVTATNTTTGCVNTLSKLVPENLIIPVATLNAVSQVRCVPADGSVTATVLPTPTQTYTYFWLLENDNNVTTNAATIIGTPTTTQTGAIGANTSTYANLHYGNYTLVVRDNFTNCISQPVTETVQNLTGSNITINDVTLPSTCGTSNGVIAINAVRNDALPTTFTVDIFKGGPTNTVVPINFYTNPPTFDPTLNPGSPPFLGLAAPANQGGLVSSIYTAVVTDGFGCKNYKTHFLSFAQAHDAVVTVNDSKICPYTIGDGSITVDVVVAPPPSAPTTKDQYTVNVYSGTLPIGVNRIFGPVSQVPVAFPPLSTPSNLAEGFYLVEVIAPVINGGCSYYQVQEVKAIALPPDVSLASAIKNNSACGAVNFDGQIDLAVAKDANDIDPTVLTYNITNNAAPFQTGVPVGTYSATSLGAGSYTFNVTASNGCNASRTYSLADNIVVGQLVASQVNLLDAQFCTPTLEQSARAAVSNVRLLSGANELITDYQFDWYTNAALTTNVFSAVGNNAALTGGDEFINNVPGPTSGTVPAGTVTAGNYWVAVTKVANVGGTGGVGCTSAPYAITIQDKSIKPAIALTPASNSSCNGSFDGSITVNVSTPSGPGAGGLYQYQWTSTATPPANSINETGINNVKGNLQDGTFTVVATNETTGCASNLSTTIVKDAPPVFTLTATTNPQRFCSADGSITVTDVRVDGVSDGTGNFNYRWFLNAPNTTALQDGTATTITTNVLNNANFATIGIGSYYVIAIRNTGVPRGSGCASAPINVNITDQRRFPTATISPASNTACNASFEGSLTVNATDTSLGGPFTYNYAWATSPVTVAAPVTTNPYSGSGNVFTGLQDGIYNLVVTNNTTSCTTTAQGIIQKVATPIVVAAATTAPLRRCILPDGSVSVTNVTVNGISDAANINTNYDYAWFDDSLVALGGAGTLSTQGSLTNGFYQVIATRRTGLSPGSGCSSSPLRVEVKDARVYPTPLLTALSNTACDTNFDGSLRVQVSDASVVPPGPPYLFGYAWSNTGSTIAASANNNGNNSGLDGDADNPVNLSDGTYNITVTNQTTGCAGIASAIIQKGLNAVSLTASATNQFRCVPLQDGTVAVNTVSVNGGGVGLATCTFDWRKASGANIGATANLASLANGLYSVTATRNPGTVPASGCTSPPVLVEIKDLSVKPLVSFTLTANTACDNNFDGRIVVTASDASGPGVGQNYNFNWTAIPAGSSIALNPINNVASPYATPVTDRIGPGVYQIDVQNTATGCLAQATTNMSTVQQPVSVVSVVKQDQLICYADGLIRVNAVSPNTVTDFTYRWYRTDPNSVPLVDGASATIVTAQIDRTNYATMGAGTYFVRATKLANGTGGSGCETAPFRVNVNDLSTKPRINFSFNPNSSCNPANPNGTLLAGAAEVSGLNTDTYSFTWQFNGASLPPITAQANTSNSSQLTQAGDGVYDITVVNVSGTGCTATGSSTITLNQSISKPNIINVTTVDPLDCNPSGNAQVTSISIGGGAPITGAPLATNFSYEWYQTNFLPANIMPSTAPTNVGLLPGSYFVLVRDLATDCKSIPKEAVIKNTSIIYPVPNIILTRPQISCLAGAGSAQLSSTADGFTDANPNYGFTWFNSLNGTGASIGTTSTLSNLVAGDYSVTVLNLTTNCTAQALYVVPNESAAFAPDLSINTIPLSFCVGFDGAAGVRVVPNPLYPFVYSNTTFVTDLYLGATPNLANPPNVPNVPLVAGTTYSYDQSNLNLGFYTFRVTDTNTGCTKTATVEVLDNRVNPLVDITQDNPMTNCDPAIANGQLAATADNGRVQGYRFDWYNGRTVSGGILQSNDRLIGRVSGDYTVRVTNNFTQCFADKTGNIDDATVKPPVPQAITLRDRTNCLTPNGEVSANVGGTIFNYSFAWYDGASTKPSPDFGQPIYSNRDIGSYTVTARDQITGCVSPPATTEVRDLRVIPSFTLSSTPSYCIDTGKPIGGGSVTLTSLIADMLFDNVQWIDATSTSPVGLGAEVTGLFPGVYRAIATSTEGCQAEGLVTVETEISPYNGISLNNDNQNDFFIIDCISNFPNNNVKIFNRSGVLVYEANGYDNATVSFKGLGEEGVYLNAKELPAGTYFYIIDKRNGSKPKTGYLELTR